jgi:uncharacterized protein (DUF2252 family)
MTKRIPPQPEVFSTLTTAPQSSTPLAERMAAGKALRSTVPRSAHAGWSPAPDRPDPVALLQAEDTNRLTDLVPLRYARMLESPFSFLRGAAAIMASDLAPTPTTSLTVQVCGDAHLANFGAYATPERNLVFDVDDFDETLAGPWEWDLKRLAASLVVAGRGNGVAAAACAEAAAAAVRIYRERMLSFAKLGYVDVWYARVDAAAVIASLPRKETRVARKSFAQARRHDNLQELSKLTKVTDGRVHIADDPPLVTHVSDERVGNRVPELVHAYRNSLSDDRRHLLALYTLVDFARKVVGVGSVGTRCYISLLVGQGTDDPLFLQVKEAGPSVLEHYVGRSRRMRHGKRVVLGQRLMQAASDIFLGWGDVDGLSFYIRQLRDMKGSVDIAALTPSQLVAYAEVCGWALARAHARSGDAAQIAGYLGTGTAFDQAITAFAQAYADQTERDHAALVKAVKQGRVVAQVDA